MASLQQENQDIESNREMGSIRSPYVHRRRIGVGMNKSTSALLEER